MTAARRGDPATTSGTTVAGHPARISEAPVDDSLPHC